MQVRGCFDKKVIDEILKKKDKSPAVHLKLIDFIRSCHEVRTYDGMWLKDKKSNDYLRLLNPTGRPFSKIDSSIDFNEVVRDNEHFSLGITADDNKLLISSTPVLSLNELSRLIEENNQTAFYVKNPEDFIKANLIHQPTAVLINDRYFFKDENPAEVLILLLKNILPIDYDDEIVITVFSHLPFELNKTEKSILEEEIAATFPHTNFCVELFKNQESKTHDRFLFTDMLCYKSENSFKFIANYESSTINRFPIYEGENFKANIEFLTDYLTNADQRILQKSKNPIIKAFLGKKEAEVVL